MTNLKKTSFEYVGYRYRPLCAIEGGMLCYKKNKIFLFDSKIQKFQYIVSLERGLKSKLIEHSRLLSRLFRMEPFSAVVFDNILFVALRNKIIEISLKTHSIIHEHFFRREDIHLRRLIKITNVCGFDDCVAFGEYFSNSKKESVRIYCTVKKDNYYDWELKFAFKPKTIRHIHSLVPDHLNKCVYIFTGDSDSESGIWRAKENFTIIEPLFNGSQKYRAGTAFVKENKLFYATDSPTKPNFIYELDLKTNKINEVCKFPGSCTSSCVANDKLFFCSTVEPPEPKNHERKQMFKYYLNKKIASGIVDEFSHVLEENENGIFVDTMQFKRDIFAGPLLLFARIIPVFDEFKNELYLYCVSVKKYDGKLFKKRL